MYAGSGIMGLEALSRGFSYAAAIEKNPKAAGIVKNNFKKFAPSVMLYVGDSLKIAPKLNQKFDIIYIDPPYFSGIYETSLKAVEEISNGIVILEHVNEVDTTGYEIIKQKKYGDKFITFLQITKDNNL